MVSNLPVFMDVVPDYEVRRGQMHITMGALELVMPVSVFLDGMARGEAAIAKWQLRQLARNEARASAEVIPIERRSKH